MKIKILNYSSSNLGHKEMYSHLLTPANFKSDAQVQFLSYLFIFNNVKLGP